MVAGGGVNGEKIYLSRAIAKTEKIYLSRAIAKTER
jgi:hypothetical protein